MIFGNMDHVEEFPYLEKGIKECFEYAKTHDLASFEKGSHEIDGDRLFVNIVEYTTTTPEERFWEAHKKYLDVHVMLRGTCLLYTSPSPRDISGSRMPSSA